MTAAPGHAKPMAIGAITALRQAGRLGREVVMGGVDAKGRGRKGIGNAVKLARGEQVQQFDFVPYEVAMPESCGTFLNR